MEFVDFLEVEVKISKAVKRLYKKTTKEVLWLYILRLLQEGPRYGYELAREIKERFGFSPARVSSYVILYKLERGGLVLSKVKGSFTGRPDRKYYEITEKGEEQMKLAKEYLKELMQKVFDKTG